jgi:hypothetical protein
MWQNGATTESHTMKASTQSRKEALESQISQLVGLKVELTVRGARSFTFSTYEITDRLHDALTKFFGKLATVRTEHDEECEGSFAYVEVL